VPGIEPQSPSLFSKDTLIEMYLGEMCGKQFSRCAFVTSLLITRLEALN
jgi:hypothetical protein